MPKIKNKQIPPIACLKPPTHPLFIPRYLWSSWLLGIQTSLQPSPCLFCQDSKRRVPLSPCNEAQYGTHTCIFLDRWLLHVPMVKGAQVFQKKKKNTMAFPWWRFPLLGHSSHYSTLLSLNSAAPQLLRNRTFSKELIPLLGTGDYTLHCSSLGTANSQNTLQGQPLLHPPVPWFSNSLLPLCYFIHFIIFCPFLAYFSISFTEDK